MTDFDLSTLLRTAIGGEDLPSETVEELFGRLMDGELSEVWKSAFLVALAAKGESVGEIAGAARAMRARAARVEHSSSGVIDTCGTGGDGRGTFNISTAAALVAAAGGARVAKHGNRAVSSRSGSADVLAALGVRLSGYTEALGRCLDEVGIAFLFAPMLHPAMAQVMPVRKELGVRTLFNVLGPLTNPAGAKRQLIGVFSRDLVEPIARVLLELGSEHALVVHGDGLDEMTTTGPTAVAEVRDGEVRTYEVRPGDFGIAETSPEDLLGGDPERNVELMRGVLDGGGGALADITRLNAGAALYVAGRADGLAAGVAAASEVQASGSAAAKLAELVDWTGWDDGGGGD
ncbi:MAG: anthranilate phosphoribosyltransferase [Holophagales bacterium]|nr:anthranilate phosphoribosyltransferase [Holophagales bacterium]MYF97305.1 anthranilate phosphoribosyltransferase [Holophagales bacterium]